MKSFIHRLLFTAVLLMPAMYAGAQTSDTAKQKPGAATFVIDEPPVFPGGVQGFVDYIRGHLRYPDAARAAGVSAKVFAKFKLNSRGFIEEVKILNPSGYGFDEEAIRVLKNSPQWTPAKSKGKRVESWFQVPISFVNND